MVYVPDFPAIVQRFGLEKPTPLSRYEEEFGAKAAGHNS